MTSMELTQEPIQYVDATPDEEYPLRILQAYRENCNCKFTDNTAGNEPEHWLCKQMNEDCDKRAAILDRAIMVIKTKGIP